MNMKVNIMDSELSYLVADDADVLELLNGG